MALEEKIAEAQQYIKNINIDGWLLYDFRGTNDLACHFLEISSSTMLTRRFWVWIPREGEPVRLVHRVEATVLDFVPGKKECYHPWKEMEAKLKEIIGDAKTIAMEYSPRNAIPYVSKVDGGTLDMVRSLGYEVVSSAPILQRFTSVLTPKQIESHLYAAEVVDRTVGEAYDFIAEKLIDNQPVTDYDVQQFIIEKFRAAGCENHGDPIVGVNADAADPHYTPGKGHEKPIREGDWILIDLWCRKAESDAIYADICRVGVAAAEPTARQQELFDLVKKARDTGIQLVKESFAANTPLQGCEVDRACRGIIESAGYGENFTHRTGHSITTRDHGEGAHNDSLETQDERIHLPGTCFAVEPAVYIPGEIGVRLEVNVLISHDGEVQVTGGVQEEITCLLENGALT